MRKSIVVGIMVLLMCIGFIGSVQSAEKVITMELSSFMGTADKLHTMLQEWADEVGKRTNGRVKINIHPGATLTPPAQTYDSVVNEVIDMGYGPLQVTTGRFPLMEVMDLPLGLKSGYNGTLLINALLKQFKPKELSNVKVLWLNASPPAYLQTRKPVRNLDDLKGLKLRSIGGTTTKVVAALGAIPVALAPTDVYDALAKGVADGAIVLSDALTTMKWGDSLKYTTLNTRTSYTNNGYLVMNLNRWKSLPPDIQQIMDKLSDEYMAKLAKLWDQKDLDAIATLKAAGHTTITLSAAEEEKWVQKLAPVYDEYVKDKTAKGLPAAAALKFCRDWVKNNQK